MLLTVRHDFAPEKFPLTFRIRSGKTDAVIWSRTITLEEARDLAAVEIPSYVGTEHYPVRAEIDFDLAEVVVTPGTTLDLPMQQRADRACRDLGIAPEVMPSGAGHDAVVFQLAGVPSGMIFVRNENGSHNPAEAMSTDDFLLGCEVLWQAIVEKAPGP